VSKSLISASPPEV